MNYSQPGNLTTLAARGATDAPRPAILVLPGGGYGRTSAHEGEPVAQWLADLGIHAFVLSYPVAPHRHPAPLSEAKRALLWIRGGHSGLAVDPERVAVLGFSAGGHLAATLSTAVPTGDAALDVVESVPNLSVLCYPVISFTQAVHQGSIDNLLGPSPSPGELSQLSAELQVSEATPPAFLWHTADDGSVPVENTFAYARAMAKCGVPAETHVFPHGRHGLGLARGDDGPDQWTALCEQWLTRQGWISTGR